MRGIPLEKLRPYLAWGCIVVAIGMVYGQALQHQFLVNWDDPFYVSINPDIRGFTLANLQAIFTKFYAGHYAPVQMLSYMIDFSIWGGKPFGFILGNLLYHTLTSILVYHFLLRSGAAPLPSLLGALVFAVHPVQVESVVWIASRKNLMSMLFMMLAFHAYLHYRALPRAAGGSWYVGCIASFSAALLAKSVAVVLVPLLLLYDWAFPGAEPRRRWLDKLPLLLAALLVAGLAVFSQQPEFNGGRATWHGGSPWATFLTMLTVLATYLRMLVWPAGLSAYYDPPLRQSPDGMVLGSALLLLVLLGGMILVARRNRPACFWMLTFLVGFLPVMHFVPLVSLMNDRYFYVPLLGAAGLVAALLSATGLPVRVHRIGNGLVALCIVALAVVSWQRVPVWRNATTLWLDAAPKASTSINVWANLVEAVFEEGDLATIPADLRADIGFPRAVRRNMAQYILRNKAFKAHLFAQRLTAAFPGWSDGYLALSETALLLGDRQQAEAAFRQAQSVAVAPPADMLVALGVAFLRVQRPEMAEDAFAKARLLQDTSAELAFGTAVLKAASGQLDEAVTLLRVAIMKKPELRTSLVTDPLLADLQPYPPYQQVLGERTTP
jgi:hypothetical protein